MFSFTAIGYAKTSIHKYLVFVSVKKSARVSLMLQSNIKLPDWPVTFNYRCQLNKHEYTKLIRVYYQGYNTVEKNV